MEPEPIPAVPADGDVGWYPNPPGTVAESIRKASQQAPAASTYVCPMHPEVVRDAEGRCPICEMPLEQVPDLYPSMTPVNNFRLIFNTYFGASLPMLPDKSYISAFRRPYEFTEIPNDCTADGSKSE